MLMKAVRYWRIVVIGFMLTLFGFAVPFLMCIQVMPTSFELGFLSFAASVAGSFLGIIGVAEFGEINS